MLNSQTRFRALFALLAALVLALGVAACGDDDDDGGDDGGGGSGELIESNDENSGVNLTIGSKNFTEQIILGEIYAQGLGAAGYTVETDLNLGSEQVALQALKAGEISGYPEYTSTALTSFFGLAPEDVPTDPAQAADDANAEFEKDGLVAFAPAPFESENAVGLLKTTADELGVDDDLGPRGQVAGPDAVRLARVPSARRLPRGARGRLRAAVQAVHARRHRAALPGAGRRSGRPVDRVHHGPAAVRAVGHST